MSLPSKCGMPSLTQNIEGLHTHATFITIFVGPPEATPAQRRWRTWLVHCLTKASRHYNNARKVIINQLHEGIRAQKELDKGRQFHIFDFSFEMEDCVTSLHNAAVCIRALHRRGEFQGLHTVLLTDEIERLRQIRNKQEHMHCQVANDQTGDGPVLITVDNDDDMKLLELSMPFAMLHRLIDAMYRDLALLYPMHNPSSAPRAPGVMQVSATATVRVIERGSSGD